VRRRPARSAFCHLTRGACGNGHAFGCRNQCVVELNSAIRAVVADLNARVMRKVGSSRNELLATIDRPALKPLPAEPYVYAEWKLCKLGLDSHVEIDQHY
jgi:hypothetical protein